MADETDRELDAVFAEARAEQAPSSLSARVLADAAQVQAETASPAASRRRRSWWREPPGFVTALGGWGGLAGVTAAGVAGLAIGLGAPGAVETLGADLYLAGGATGWTPDLAQLALEGDDV